MKRLLSLFVLLPALAIADEGTAPAPRTRVVGVILSTSQVLVWEEDKGEYALRRVGEQLEAGRILLLENDHVVIDRDGARVTVDIAGAPQKAPRRAKRMPAVIIGALGQPEAPAPVAPPAVVGVAPAPVAAASPAAPPAMVVVAPPPVAVPAQPPVATAPVAAPAAAAPPVVVVAAAPPPAAAPLEPEEAEVEAMVIPRTDLDRELGDFGSLSREAQVAPASSGGFQLMQVRPGSFVSRVGLRAGDVIVRVDGRTINKLEDAAAAYSWLRVTDRFTVDLLRAGQPMRLHYIIAPTAPRATR